MRIGINTLYVIPGGVGGAEYYLANLLTGLGGEDRDNQYVLFVTRRNERLYDVPSKNFKKVVIPFPDRDRLLRVFIEQTILPYLAVRERLDLLHNPNNISTVIKSCGSVLTIQALHCFMYKDDPEFPLWARAKLWYLRNQLRIASLNADHIITPSESTRQDAIRLLKVSPERVTCVPHYVSIASLFPEGPDSQPEILNKYGVTRPYIFSPSSMLPYKNLIGMLSAFKEFKLRYRLPHTLVVAGRDDISYYSTVVRYADELGVREHFRYLGEVSHDEVPSLYRYADVTFYPTYCETFGIPVLESMAFGTPVVCSNRTSLPEVAGDAAVLVDPDDPGQMSHGICEAITNTELRNELVSKGYERARYFTCEEAARQTIRIYEHVGRLRHHGRAGR